MQKNFNNNNVNSTKKNILLKANNNISKQLIDKISNDHNYIKLLTPNEILSLLGHPNLIKKTNNIIIWQYRKDVALNIIWGENTSLQNIVHKNSLNQENNLTPNKTNTSIIWLECITRDKKQQDSSYCFLQLTKLN